MCTESVGIFSGVSMREHSVETEERGHTMNVYRAVVGVWGVEDVMG